MNAADLLSSVAQPGAEVAAQHGETGTVLHGQAGTLSAGEVQRPANGVCRIG